MKRKDIITTIDLAGELMDLFGCAVTGNLETGDPNLDVVTRDEIRAMQTTLCVCMKMLEGKIEPDNPIELATVIIAMHGTMKLKPDSDQDSQQEVAEGDADD